MALFQRRGVRTPITADEGGSTLGRTTRWRVFDVVMLGAGFGTVVGLTEHSARMFEIEVLGRVTYDTLRIYHLDSDPQQLNDSRSRRELKTSSPPSARPWTG